VAVVALLVVLAVLLGNRDDGTATDAGASTSPSPSTASAAPTESGSTPAPTAPATEPAAGPEEFPAALPAVDLDEAVPVEDVTLSVVRIEEIDGQATGPGDVAGPALRITLRLVNDGDAEVSLAGAAVNAYHGAELTPAPQLNDPSTSYFAGDLAPGEAAEAVYVFRVPPDQRDRVTVEVGYRPGAPLAVFTGAV
jgi:hypothetical protein